MLWLRRARTSSRSSSATPSVGAEKDTRSSILIRRNTSVEQASSPTSSLKTHKDGGLFSPYVPLSSTPPLSLSLLIVIHRFFPSPCSRDSVRLFSPLGAEWVASPPKFFRLYTLGSCYGTWECSQAWKPTPPHGGNTRCNGPRAVRAAMGSSESPSRSGFTTSDPIGKLFEFKSEYSCQFLSIPEWKL